MFDGIYTTFWHYHHFQLFGGGDIAGAESGRVGCSFSRNSSHVFQTLHVVQGVVVVFHDGFVSKQFCTV